MDRWLKRASWAGMLMLCAAGCSRDPRPGTQAAAAEGERLMRRMSDTLARASTLRFTTQESLEEPGDPSRRRVFRFSRSVTVRRPDGMFFELHGVGDTSIDVAAHYDGKTVSLRDGRHGVWAQTEVPATLDEMLDDVSRRFSLPVPIADVVYSVPQDAFVGPSTSGGFVGRETIDGVECAYLAYSDDLLGVHVFVPVSGEPLPRRVELVYKQVAGEPRARIDYTSWELAPAVDDASFAFQPAPDSRRIPFEDFVLLQMAGVPSTGPAAAGEAAAGEARPR